MSDLSSGPRAESRTSNLFSQNSRTVNTNDHMASFLFQDSEGHQNTTEKKNKKRKDKNKGQRNIKINVHK
jgi:hypothetical protein